MPDCSVFWNLYHNSKK